MATDRPVFDQERRPTGGELGCGYGSYAVRVNDSPLWRGWPGRPGIRSAVLRQVRWCADPLLLAAVALAFDAVYRRIRFRIWTTGPVDEVAHLSTAALGLLVLARFIDAPRRFYVAALIASVAIDVDHIPLYLGLLRNRT